MFLPKSVYVDFILATEKPKRLEGILQEQFFERSLVPKMKEGTAFSFGWARTWCEKLKQRVWCHIIDQDNPPTDSSVSDRYSELLAAENEDDLVVEIKASLRSESDKIVGLDIDVFEYKDHRWRISEEHQGIIKGYLEEGKWLRHDRVNRRNEALRGHLETLTAAELNRLVVTRILLNYGLGCPVDIDAVFLRNGVLGVVEYKRKDPMQGHFPFIEQPRKADRFLTKLMNDFITYLSIKDPMESESQINYEVVRKHFWSFIETHPFRRLIAGYEKESCFGLDVSHVRMVEFCKRVGMNYQYLIWNHARPNRGESLLSKELLPVPANDELVFQANNTRYSEVDGLNLTIGLDSGSFTDDVSSGDAKEQRLKTYKSIRLQATFRNSQYRFRALNRFRDFG